MPGSSMVETGNTLGGGMRGGGNKKEEGGRQKRGGGGEALFSGKCLAGKRQVVLSAGVESRGQKRH